LVLVEMLENLEWSGTEQNGTRADAATSVLRQRRSSQHRIYI